MEKLRFTRNRTCRCTVFSVAWGWEEGGIEANLLLERPQEMVSIFRSLLS